MSGRAFVVIVAVAVLVGGCRKKNDPNARGGQVALGDSTQFESAEDPPISADTHFAAGQLAESQDQLPRAVDQYQAALKVDPKFQPAMFRLGTVQTQAKMFPEAIATWQKYIKATGGSAAAYNNLGFTYELARQPKEAETAYKQAIAKDPKYQQVRMNYGLMLARQARKPEAMQQLSTVLKPAEVHYNLGSVYEQQGKTEQAKAEYQQALLLDANLHDARARLTGLK
jgi:tetratricopeptide (TPR) repeat protein